MRRRFRNQLMLDLDYQRRRCPAEPVPEGLVNALADLLLEALGNQNNAMPAEREGCDAFQDNV